MSTVLVLVRSVHQLLQANASFGICLDISNDLFDASVDLTVKGDNGATEKGKSGAEMEKVAPVSVPDANEDDIKVKRVALVGKGSSEGGEGPSMLKAHTKILSTTRKVLTSSSTFPARDRRRENHQLKNKIAELKTQLAAPTVPVKTASKLLERDLKKSASKVTEESSAEPERPPAKDGSGKKPKTGNNYFTG